MPVKTTISVKIEHAPQKAFGRELEITRITGDFTPGSQRDQNRVDTYQVILTGGMSKQRATFEHRYGDDLLTLITEAIQAIPGTNR